MASPVTTPKVRPMATPKAQASAAAQAMNFQADEAAMSEVLAEVIKDDIPLRQALHIYLSRSYKATVIK